MPFYSPYKDIFREGDLVYGLSHVRSSLYARFFLDIEKYSRGIWTVDNYRPSTIAGKLRLSHAISAKFQGGFDGAKAQEKLKLKDDAAYIKQHLAKFQDDIRVHSKYSRYGDLLKHFDFEEEKFAEALKSKDSVTNDAWRAKSKFGMEWTVKQNAGKDPHFANTFIHIHFVLDCIDMAAVVTKTHQYKDEHGVIIARDFPRGKGKTITEGKERTITHSELRWIYRNRKNPLVQYSIQFWLMNKPCCPPWENDTEKTTLPSGRTMTWKYAWLAYKPSMEHETFD